jgi:hypothetical protein
LKFKASQANSSESPYLEKPFTKRVGGVSQGEGPEFKSQYLKKQKTYYAGRTNTQEHKSNVT